MNPFVNLQKRSIQLPKGCKDLIDVLRLPGAQGTIRRIEAGGLSRVEHYLSRLLQSVAKHKTLLISSLDGQDGWVLIHDHDEGALTVTVFVACSDSVREEAVRSLFAQAGINPTTDPVMSKGVVPNRGLSYPLPADAPRAAQLTAELMRRAYGLTDEAEVEFLYGESDAA